jgi:hypothetical protein
MMRETRWLAVTLLAAHISGVHGTQTTNGIGCEDTTGCVSTDNCVGSHQQCGGQRENEEKEERKGGGTNFVETCFDSHGSSPVRPSLLGSAT